jgi:hypothetical protein
MKLILILLSFIPFATAGPVLCGTGENVAKTGGTAWTNPGNITANDNVDATCTGTSSQYLYAHNFDFSSLPWSATVTNVVASVELTTTGSTINDELDYQFIDNNGSPFDAGEGGNMPGGTTRTVYPLDYRTLPTAVQIKDPDFGIRLSVTNTSSATVAIDYVSITVTYTAGNSGGLFTLMSKSQ